MIQGYSFDPEDYTLLNRSYSVDTDHYMRHLHMKSKNYNVMTGLGEGQKQEDLRNLSKLERQLRLMEYMENASTKNPFRSMKLKSLLEKQDMQSKQELRRMLQQEEAWANLSVMAHSDDEIGGYVPRGHHSRGDLGKYLPKNVHHFS